MDANTCPTPSELHLAISESWHKDLAAAEASELSSVTGFSSAVRMLIATATAELATNILRYAGHGELTLRVLRESERIGIEICAIDNGCGIKDIEMAMQDHFTTTPGSLGLGLPSVRRMMDDFEINSAPDRGTRVLARKWRNLDHH
ncbi:anti-sigma regulatory factor [Niveibacterium terrae]|uniref:anti-sigma regulatory factor n=1 Tax=Niveibacterium terrae TaxID=3373598 RepID=UPI003A8E5C52